MKLFTSVKKITLLLLASWISFNAFSQCPTCTPDETCISADGMPTVCPLIPPNGTAGVYYEEQLTFYMPAEVLDPGSGFTATLIDVIITSVTGLPYGIQFTLNDDDATFHPSAGENFGCATMCGTPLLPGTYDVVITVTANVQVSVFNATQVETFISTVVVEPGVGSANTFSPAEG